MIQAAYLLAACVKTAVEGGGRARQLLQVVPPVLAANRIYVVPRRVAYHVENGLQLQMHLHTLPIISIKINMLMPVEQNSFTHI
jgi:hypothetical protein